VKGAGIYAGTFFIGAPRVVCNALTATVPVFTYSHISAEKPLYSTHAF